MAEPTLLESDARAVVKNAIGPLRPEPKPEPDQKQPQHASKCPLALNGWSAAGVVLCPCQGTHRHQAGVGVSGSCHQPWRLSMGPLVWDLLWCQPPMHENR